MVGKKPNVALAHFGLFLAFWLSGFVLAGQAFPVRALLRFYDSVFEIAIGMVLGVYALLTVRFLVSGGGEADYQASLFVAAQSACWIVLAFSIPGHIHGEGFTDALIAWSASGAALVHLWVFLVLPFWRNRRQNKSR